MAGGHHPRGSNKPAAAALIKDRRASLHGQTFTLEFSSNFNVDRISKNEAGRRMIEDQINRTLGEPDGTYKIKGVLRGEAGVRGQNRAGYSRPAARPRSRRWRGRRRWTC